MKLHIYESIDYKYIQIILEKREVLMKKKISIISILMIFGMLFAKSELTIYAYDSMSWIEDKLIADFEQANNCKIKLVKFSNTGKILARLKLEKVNPRADIIIGLTPTLTGQAKKENLLMKSADITNLKKIKDESYIFDKEGFVIPYDFGALAIIYNPESLKNPPMSFEDLTSVEKNLIIQDPRTSTTGQDFLLWTIAVYGNQWQDFWKRLKPAILTVSPGWSEAFAKFEVGEAPMMVSYATDGAYSFHNYQSTKYKALIPQEGGYTQKEGVAIVNGSKNEKLANSFINFMLSDRFQSAIPLNQWMFPVTNVKLPKAYDYAIQPDKILQIDKSKVDGGIEIWLEQWEKIMQ